MKKVTNAQRTENLKKVAPLNQYLKDNHISQSDVAQKSGLHLGTINRILHGWQPLMPNTLQRIADALGVEYYILNGENAVQRTLNMEEVCGYLEYKGTITKVSSVYDVKCWLKSIEGSMPVQEDEPVVIRSKVYEDITSAQPVPVAEHKYNVKCSDEGYAYFYQNVPFSNFWAGDTQLEFDGHKFNSSEAVFMYQKAMLFGDTEVASKIVETDNDSSFETLLKRCTAVKKLGRKVRGFVQETWDAECYGMMYNAIQCKAEYDMEFRSLLLSPEYAGMTFVEATHRDVIWANGLSIKDSMALGRDGWTGQNLLGQALTELRNKLRPDLAVKVQ